MKWICAALLAALTGAAAGQTVGLQGTMGSKALLIVNNTPPRSVGPGETHLGVKVLAVQGEQAVVEIDGKRHTLRVGDAPASVGGGGPVAGGNRIVIAAGSRGHFLTPGTINGRTVQFMVDTGASGVGLSTADAEKIGLNYKGGTPIRISTANGTIPGWLVRLDSVRIGDVEVHGVEAAVSAGAMPYVLLGNSFLTRFQMRRDNDQLILERRY
jgi:aspartyl protease family protein